MIGAIVSAAIGCGMLLAGGGDVVPTPPPTVMVGGELKSVLPMFDEPEDFGVVDAWKPLSRTLHLTNRLDVPVGVEVIEKSCGCLSCELSSPTIPPGGFVTVRMSVSPAEMAGPQMQYAKLALRWDTAGGPRVERAVFGLRYETRVSYWVRPKVVRLGLVEGEAARVSLVLREQGPFLQAVRAIRSALSEVVVQPERDPQFGDEAWVTHAEIRAGGAGVRTGEIEIETDAERGALARVPVALRVLPPWAFEPAGAVILGREPRDVRVRLVARGGNAPAVAAVRAIGTPEWVSLELTGAGTDRAVVIRFRPPAESSTGSGGFECLDAQGRVVGAGPIVWWFD
ncbi:MAG: DUF1573 domain-containing protein [Phycisphaeraceae bacterium]|nr:DUF1573 domain-containing protein [Phycisphaeraceae bacterium]